MRRHKSHAASIVLLGVAVLGGGCALPPTGPAAPTTAHGTRYVYVLLGEEGRAVARAITSAAACPAIDFDGAAQPMDVRAQPATIAKRVTRFNVADAKPAEFPVLTCEKAIPAGVTRATIDGRALPLPKANPTRIVVIGDTGCRLQRYGNIYQSCNDPARWPFRSVVAAAAASAPDLVVHVGDYHYREDPCPDGDTQCAGSPWGYGWDTWDADFFAPAAALLAAAPWIVVRGNHETCDRAGQGWWRFLDPRPPRARQDCNDAANDAIGSYSEPYAVPLGAAAGGTQFIVFDSSQVGIPALQPSDPMYRTYLAQFTQAFALAARSPRNLFLDHHPILGFAPHPSQPASPYPGNAGLQSVLDALQPGTLFPSNVQATIAGHIHLFEVVSFATAQPAQLIVGNSGDWVDDAFPVPFPATLTPAPGAKFDMITSTNKFGYVTMEPDAARWKVIARDVRGAPMSACVLAGGKADCTPVAAP